MWFLSLLVNILFADIQRTLISLSIGFVVFKLIKFYVLVLSLPPGPFPLPVLGNVLMFRKSIHSNEVLRECAQKYGPVFTIWLASLPAVVITDADILREAFRGQDLMGRPHSYLSKFVSNKMFHDIIHTDYNQSWESLWRVGRMASQKYATNVKLESMVSECVDQTMKLIIEREGIDEEFCPNEYIEVLILNIMTENAFSVSYSMEDEEFKVFKDFAKIMGNSRMVIWILSSFVRLLDWRKVKVFINKLNQFIDIVNKEFMRHKADYNPSIERDFCDAIITARNAALTEGKESAVYLTDKNLALLLFDMIEAGADTSQTLFKWLLLLMTYYPKTQQKLRKEIENQIGDRIATHEDRNRCHYVMSFIAEGLRFRNTSPSALPHKTLKSTKVGDFTIPEGISVIGQQGIILTDEKHWPKAQEFTPERFLENNKYVTSRSKAYIPFGVGRRSCLGDKLAINEMFLILVRFIQKTADYDIVLGTNQGLDPNPEKALFSPPMEYNIILKSKSNP